MDLTHHFLNYFYERYSKMQNRRFIRFCRLKVFRCVDIEIPLQRMNTESFKFKIVINLHSWKRWNIYRILPLHGWVNLFLPERLCGVVVRVPGDPEREERRNLSYGGKNIMPYSQSKVNWRFGGKYHLHLHSRRMSQVIHQHEAGRKLSSMYFRNVG
jgi:hypothetical protein